METLFLSWNCSWMWPSKWKQLCFQADQGVKFAAMETGLDRVRSVWGLRHTKKIWVLRAVTRAINSMGTYKSRSWSESKRFVRLLQLQPTANVTLLPSCQPGHSSPWLRGVSTTHSSLFRNWLAGLTVEGPLQCPCLKRKPKARCSLMACWPAPADSIRSTQGAGILEGLEQSQLSGFGKHWEKHTDSQPKPTVLTVHE